MSHRPRRRSYRRRLARSFLLRYLACVAVAAPALAVTLAAGSLAPMLAVALILYPACGFCLARYLCRRVIWLAVEPARRIGEAERAMLLLWPIQAVRFLRHLSQPADALSEGE